MTAVERVKQELREYHIFVKFLMAVVAAGAIAAASRFIFGLGTTTNLSDTYPLGALDLL